jgi:putative ATP-binding cassette transporter
MTLFAMLTRRSRGALVLAVGCGALGGAASTAFLALVNHQLGHAGLTAPAFAAGFAVVSAAMLATYVGSRWILIRLLQREIHRVRLQLSRQLLAAPLRQLERIGTARLVTILTEDVSAIAGALGVLPSLAINGVITLGILVYLGVLSPLLFGLVVVLLGAAVVSYVALDRRAAAALRHARDALDQLGEDLEDLVLGNRELKLARDRRLAFLTGELTPHLDTVRDRTILGNTQYALAISWGQVLTVLLIGAVLFVAPAAFTLGDEVVRGYVLAIIQITGAIAGLLEAAPQLRRAQIAWARIERLELELDAEPRVALAAPVAPGSAQLDLVDVTYAVDRPGDQPFVLGPVNLTLRPGELVFVAGGNGSGKTTLAKVLAGLYPPTSGQIRIDGAAVAEPGCDDYRQLFSVAFTDGHVFRSLLGLDEAHVQGQLVQFELDPWVHVAGGEFSTTALSQGQRKRLLLITALAQDRPFYIFDEWTANQDPEHRERFYREILPALKARGKAVVVITHDDRYDALADAVLRLDRGVLRHPQRQATLQQGPRS